MGELVAYNHKYQAEVAAVELQRAIAEQATDAAKYELMKLGIMQRAFDERNSTADDYDHRPY